MIKRRAISLSLILILIFSIFGISGCSTTTDFTVYYGIDKMPNNLDPILSDSFSEILAAKNCFRGLFKIDSNDQVVKDLVKEFKVNEKGTEYTFILNENIWDNGTPVTAHDFVFALQRAALPETSSPYISEISNIKGVSDCLNCVPASIGVVAENDKILKFTLVKPDPFFLFKLTSPVFLPCNKEFFEKSGGKYGLDTKHILTNGNYKVSLWSDEKYIKLKLNTEIETNNAIAEYVVLTESKTGKSNAKRIKDKEISMATVSGEDYSIVSTENYTIDVKFSKTYALIFNKNKVSAELIEAFTKSIHREQFASKLNERFKLANNIIPEDSIIITNSAKDVLTLPEYKFNYDPKTARQMYLNAINQKRNTKAPVFKVKYYGGDAEIKDTLNLIISNWQSNLGVYISLNSIDSQTMLMNNINTNDFEIAVVTLSNSVTQILNTFVTDNSDVDYGINNNEFNALFSELNNADSLESSVSAANKCISIISEDPSVFPIISVPTAYIYDSTLKNVHFSKFDGTVDFSLIYK